jgi:hypothetical protein
MAAKKKSAKTKSKKTARKPISPKKKRAVKKATSKKTSAKKSVKKKAAVKAKPTSQKLIGGAKSAGGLKQRQRKRQDVNTVPARSEGRERSGQQSGDLQGLSDFERADSESVDELLEEGNAFEADVVSGVQAAGDAEEKEVRTHEVPEDDVPDEYLDNEK